ncbi:calcium influx-promoting protein ehs1 [Seiridium cupressi]
MQLSPLQSRLAASLAASFLILVIYLFLFSPQFAFAAEIPFAHGDGSEITGLWALAGENEQEGSAETLDLRSPKYEPEFALFDRSIIGRAPAGVTSLSNNVKSNQNLNEGTSVTFVFEAASISGREADESRVAELRKRSGGSPDQDAQLQEEEKTGGEDAGLEPRASPTKTLWISGNTCLQPERPSANRTAMDPPQLTLYVSTSRDNESPGPGVSDDLQDSVVFNEGAVMYNMTFTDDVYFTVTAPNVSDWFASSLYNVDIAASIDQSYHSYDDETNPNLVWVDSDAGAALLMTGNLTNSSATVLSRAPYTMYANPQDDVSINGVRNSYCGLKEYAQIGGSRSTLPSNMMSTGLTRRGEGNVTKQEFFITGLNKSSVYEAILIQEPLSGRLSTRDDVAGGGGVVFRQTEFDTKSTNTCMVISNLTFCDQTAYSVPGNEQKYSGDKIEELKSFYDDYAKQMYDNFSKAMMQVQCNTTNTSKYSLAKGCDDCKTAYKNWVCSVAIPRCEDFSKPDDFLQMRNIMAPFPDGSRVEPNLQQQYGMTIAYNSSRSPRIDDEVQPGPYKEVLPCDDLCYDVVQSCPAVLSLGCPQPGMVGFETSYGRRQAETDGTSNVTCNYPGSAHYISAASPSMTISLASIVGCVVMVALLL